MRLELFVDDPTTSVAFYVDVLGFVVVGRDTDPDSTAGKSYSSLELEGSRIAIQGRQWLSAGHPLARAEERGVGVEIVLPVKDVHARHAVAVSTGANPSDLVEQPWGLTDFRVQDPDGYYLRVTSI